ncbi:synaptotagmin-like protein 2 isoform X2 [Astyanax mexicanus]|uniref:synaptotagmin-like protein 2 isoform X2 n=1 Tax=Astyanax mexicanus TaxID=7994 RepID=UPI0020CB4D50|nr:synaptotagmin-like protein 2 isoform X2 [Astyanax mexicanus]
MIDLSYLTEEEQEMIRTVLKRDNELKKKEEQRIKKLQKTEGDKRKLKYLTGEWFYETKSNRHRDRIHGSDIIRASMRHSQPVTILELSEICPEKPSFLNSKSKDVFIPPELCGILEDFPSCDKREDHYQLAETQQNTCSPTAQPQIKPRLNPFNSKLLSAGSPKKTSGAEETHLVPATLNQTPKDTLLITASQQQQPAAGPHTTPTKLDQTSASESGQTPAQELPPSAVPLNTSQNTDSPKSTPSATRQLAKKKLLLYFSHDSVLNTTSDPVSRQDMSPSPRGILKHSSSSGSFTDSLSLRNSCSSQPTSPLSPESSDNSHSPPLSPSSDLSSSGCLDRKQVRFSPIVQARDTGSLEAQDTKEHGEHGLLDQDASPIYNQEGEPDMVKFAAETANTSTLPENTENSLVGSQPGPQISTQPNPIDKPDSTPPESSVLSCEKVGEFLASGSWSDGSAAFTTNHHGNHAEPHSLQVPKPYSTPVEKGKAIHLSPEGQAHTLTEEEGNSIVKVLEWFGRVSKDSSKVKEKPASPEDANKEVPESLDTQVTDTASPTQEEAKAKPSPKPRRGLLALFSRTEAKVESPKNVATQEDVVSNSENIISQESKLPQTPPNSEADDISDLQSSLKLNVVTEQETSPLLLKTEDSANLDKESDEITKQKEGLDQGERSPNRLDSLKSFWERGNKGPKILSIKKSTDSNHSEMPNMSEDENKAMDLKPPEVPISPSTVKTLSESSEAPDEMLYTYVDSLESDKIIRQGADSSFLPSHEEQSPTFEIDQIPQEPCKSQTTAEESQSSPVKQKEQKDEILPPVPSIRKFPTQENTEPVTFSNLKSLWEKEKSGPKILISTTECVQAVHDVQDISDVESLDNNSKSVNETHLNVAPPSPDPVQDPKRRKSSLTREAEKIMLSLKEKIEKSQRKQSPGRVRAKSPLRGMSHSPDHVSPFKPPKSVSEKGKKLSPRLSPIRNVSSDVQDHQSADENLNKVQLSPSQSKTTSPKNQPKVPPRDVYPVKESRKNGSPLRAFSIDINPTEKTPVDFLENKRPSVEFPSVKSLIDHSGPISDKKSHTKHPEEHVMPISGETSEPNPQYQLITSQQSPSSLGRFQTPGGTKLGNISGITPFHSSPKSHGQTSAHQMTSPEHHRKLSDQGTDGSPIMIRDKKQWIDLHPSIRLARSYIPLSYQYYLGLPESTNKSARSDQPEKQEWLRVELGESSAEVFQGRVSNESSPSRCSQPESEEITFDSSRSASPEAWLQSRTSSVCGSVEPSPVRAVLKQANVRPISISKSLENLASLPSREERRKIESRSDITVSVEDVSAGLHVPGPSVSDPEQMKMLSVSVPAFIQQQRSGRESDSTSVNSFYSERQRKDSTYTNLSSSSDLAPYSVSGSVMSIYGTDFGNVEVKGTIQFAINYVQKLAEFHIFIVQCRDLAVAEPKRNRSDPYVKCYLLPDKEKLGKRKTSVKKKTLNPTYNEILRFKITLDNLKSHTLNLSVWHNDTFGKNSFLGEVDVDLSEWDFSNSHMMDYALKGRVPVQSSPKHVSQTLELSGEMRVALRFLTQTTQSKKTPQNGEVQIWVKECKNLPARRGTIDPFIKCAVLPDTARKGRQKTRVVKRTANPVFNHTMVYDGLRPEDLREACVELTVWDHDRLSNHFIGGLRLGLGTGKSYGSEVDWMDSNTAEAGLWKRMTESQNEWVEDVIPLRMLIMARTVSK